MTQGYRLIATFNLQSSIPNHAFALQFAINRLLYFDFHFTSNHPPADPQELCPNHFPSSSAPPLL